MTEHGPVDDNAITRRGVVGAVVREGKYLVIRRSETVSAPRKICFPGGGIEGAETEAEALVREFAEELGVEARPVRRLWRSVTRWRIELFWWLAELDPQAVLAPNPAEVAEALWLAPDEIMAQVDLLESNRAFFAALLAGEFAVE